MTELITPVLLCGGSGTRLWPRSRSASPKPFLPLIGQSTLFQQALERCSGDSFAPAVIVTGAEQEALVEQQVGESPVAEIIVEPEPRQTAAAIALAAGRLPPETVMLVCPSDHHVGDSDAFADAALQAAAVASEGRLVCLGIAPEGPETKFGYIERGEALESHPGAYKVATFKEKPNLADASRYIETGRYLWNGGIFAFRSDVYLAELERYRPRIAASAAEAVAGGVEEGGRFRPASAPFSKIEPESVDYGVMEHSDRVAMVMARMQWSDVGDWSALYAAREKDGLGNSVRGPAELVDCRRVMIDSDGPRVHAIGLEDIVIVVDGDDILVTSAAGTAKVGQLGRSAQ